MKGERLELVTDFATLRAGMIVVIQGNGCGCQTLHRGIVLGPTTPCPRGDASLSVEPRKGKCGFRVEVCGGAIRGRRVWKVIDGLENDQTTTTTKKRELAK